MSGISSLNKPSDFFIPAVENQKDEKNKPLSGIHKLNNNVKNRPKSGVGQYELSKMLDEMIVQEAAKESIERGVRTGQFYPSSLGSECDRFLYLSYNGLLPLENIRDAANLRRLSNGHSLEDRFFKYFLKLNIYREREKRIASIEPPIRGRIDFIVQLPQYPHKTLIELKTINDRGFTSLSGPKPEHKVQLQLYLNILDMPHGIIIYENKDNQQFKEFHMWKDIELWENIKNRCSKIQNMISVPESPKTNHSRYCGCRAYKN